jgi:hypothetical protein
MVRLDSVSAVSSFGFPALHEYALYMNMPSKGGDDPRMVGHFPQPVATLTAEYAVLNFLPKMFSQFHNRQAEVEANARLIMELEDTADDFSAPIIDGGYRWPHQRAYCADCDTLKGSKTKNRYYPEQACPNCGSTRTNLRNKQGKVISWEKWVARANEWADAEMARKCAEEYSE